MEIETIRQIREQRDLIREKIRSIDFNIYGSTTYGGENEFNFKGLIGGIEALLTDVSALLKAPNKFIKISTSAERRSILGYLTRIHTYFESPSNYIDQFEALKTVIRSYNIRDSFERQIEFETEIEETLKIKLQLQQELLEVQKLRKKIDDTNKTISENINKSNDKFSVIENELNIIINKKNELIEQSETLEEINVELLKVKEKASINLNEIITSTSESKSNEKLISSFASKVQERDKRLLEIEQKTEEYKAKLTEYETAHNEILNESKKLIESAKKALNYKTAEGISASFQTQYEQSNKKKFLVSWILGAILCLLGTISLGMWVLNTAPSEIGLIIGRIALLPLPIIGAIFCANQYTKQKNIIEDYAYKMVLSKSIVGFSEQLKRNGSETNEEYIHYVKTALEEIHKDPLRKRENEKNNKSEIPHLKDLIEIAEKISKLTKLE